MSPAGRRIPIKAKLLAVLAVPVLGYLIVTTAAVIRARNEANRISEQASVVKTAVGPTSLSTSLIDERTITALADAGIDDELTLRVGDLTQARRATDQHLSALQTLIDDNATARQAYKDTVDEVASDLASLRQDVDGGQVDIGNVFSRYSEHITTLMDANEIVVETVDDAELWQGAKLAELATRQKDARALLINALVPVGFNEDDITTEQSVGIGRVLGSYQTRDAALRGLATGPYARPGSVLVEALETNDLAALATAVLESGELNLADLYAAASFQAGFVYEGRPTGDFIHDSFRGQVVDILEDDASQRSAAAARSLRTHLLTGTGGLLLTALIAFTVTRSITRPLRSLTDQAIDTATDRLPSTVQEILQTPLGDDVVWPQMVPIEVISRDEVADVAQALNTMQDAALRLAVEEAILRRHITDSLVTLGQRNQTLLSRQIAFITDLERDETDPDILGNLFYLDHLATRMRRNAESLLVLAGIDPPRKWVGPTPVNDVIRAALGEAEEYKRVRVDEVSPATVVGSAAAELSHLLAELIENALVFSPPNKKVEVKGQRRPLNDLSPGGYTITVRDFGVGMSHDELAQANRRLAGEESYTIAPSKYMGHYVAGKLADRHGLMVQLHNAREGQGGTVATVELPEHLLTTEAPTSDATEHMPPLPPVGPVSVPSAPTRADREREDEVALAEDEDEVAAAGPATLATLASGPGPGEEPTLENDELDDDLDEYDDEYDDEQAEVYHLHIPPPEPLEPLEARDPGPMPDEGPLELPPPVPLVRAAGGRADQPPPPTSRAPQGRHGGAPGGRPSGGTPGRPAGARQGRSNRPKGQGRGQGQGQGQGRGQGQRQAQAQGQRQGQGQAQATSRQAARKAQGTPPAHAKPKPAPKAKPKKRKKRSPPLAANKLPVPPPSAPLEASSDD